MPINFENQSQTSDTTDHSLQEQRAHTGVQVGMCRRGREEKNKSASGKCPRSQSRKTRSFIHDKWPAGRQFPDVSVIVVSHHEHCNL